MLKNIFSCLMVLILLLFSCSKQDPISDLEELCIELEEKSEFYSDQDWKQVQNRMKVIDEELSINDYTSSERQYIDKLKGKYIGFLVRAKSKQTKKFIEELPSKIQSTTEGLFEVMINED